MVVVAWGYVCPRLNFKTRRFVHLEESHVPAGI